MDLAKQHLKREPDKFKIIITSRERIASGFHPIKLLTNYYIFENNGTRNAYRMIKELT